MTDEDFRKNGVTMIVPTFKRPEGLKIALTSLQQQTAGDKPLEIIIVDNDKAASAKDYVLNYAKSSKIPLHYVHVPAPGVSSARNGAMEIARGRFIAFLDDDMEATRSWLSELVKTAETHKADAVFGPIDAKMPRPNDPLNIGMHPYFSRYFDGPEGRCDVAFGMGGCLLDLNGCEMPSPPFNTDMNEVGGEDDWLFSVLMGRGMQMGWAPKALTYEHVPASRLSLEYFWNRNFAFGQGPTQIEADKGVSGTLGIAKWMIIGALQTVVYAPTYKILKAFNKPSHVVFYAKFAQGLGKVLWWDGFSPRMYGSGAPENKAA